MQTLNNGELEDDPTLEYGSQVTVCPSFRATDGSVTSQYSDTEFLCLPAYDTCVFHNATAPLALPLSINRL